MALMGVDRDPRLHLGAGYLATELFGFVLPLLVLVLTIGTGANAVAGAEERGMLDLVLSHPVSRRSYLLQQAMVVVVEAMVLGSVVVGTLLVAEPLVDLDLSVANLVGTVLGLALVALVLGWLALALGAATGSRALALGGASAFAAFAYLAATLPALVDGMDPVTWISPFLVRHLRQPADGRLHLVARRGAGRPRRARAGRRRRALRPPRPRPLRRSRDRAGAQSHPGGGAPRPTNGPAAPGSPMPTSGAETGDGQGPVESEEDSDADRTGSKVRSRTVGAPSGCACSVGHPGPRSRR